MYFALLQLFGQNHNSSNLQTTTFKSFHCLATFLNYAHLLSQSYLITIHEISPLCNLQANFHLINLLIKFKQKLQFYKSNKPRSK